MNKYLNIGFLFTLLWWAHSALAQDTIPLNTTHSFQVSDVPGYTYSWWYTNETGVMNQLSSTSSQTEEYLWDTKGKFEILVQAKDSNNCLSEIISKPFIVIEKDDPAPMLVYAGPDTLIGSCALYTFADVYPIEDSYTYSWSPASNLDDPTLPNPVFTPGETTTYVLTVTSVSGVEVKDTVTISVSEIVANAGDDILLEQGETAILDGSASLGNALTYWWTTENGTIDSGENTINPIVSSPGTYYLQVIDSFNCIATDSVLVSKLVYAPVANDDYDTTSVETSVVIPVLTNDTDPQGDLDPTSLSIVQYPQNGSVYINYDEHTISYTPAEAFVGDDVFEYQICNLAAKCDNANVYVFVTPVDFVIPEAFTPNGDGVNDYFEIKGIEMYEGNSLTVVNRWGKKVYEAKNYGINTTPTFWNGKWTTGGGNEDLPTGTYFYVLDLGNNEKPIAGSVYIDR